MGLISPTQLASDWFLLCFFRSESGLLQLLFPLKRMDLGRQLNRTTSECRRIASPNGSYYRCLFTIWLKPSRRDKSAESGDNKSGFVSPLERSSDSTIDAIQYRLSGCPQ